MANILRGHRVSDFGTTGDMFVDASGGSDANSGTTVGAAKATIGAAIAALGAGGGKIKVRAGTYREALVIGTAYASGAPLIIEAYGAEQWALSGSDPETGWAPCTSADQSLVGANWASMYKKTIPLSRVPDAYPAILNPHSQNTRLQLATDSLMGAAWEDWMQYDGSKFHLADSVTLSGGLTTRMTKPTVVSNYTIAQMALCLCDVWQGSNFIQRVGVTKSGGDIVLSTATDTGDSGTVKWKNGFCLLNSFPSLRAGTWAFDDSVANQVTIYIWPPAGHDASQITLARRSKLIDLTNSAYVELRGFTLERWGGTEKAGVGGAQAGGNAINGHSCSHITIEDVAAINGSNMTINGATWPLMHNAALNFRSSNHILVHRVTLSDLSGMEGYTASACSFVAGVDLFFEKISRESTWMQSSQNTVIGWAYHRNTSSHRHNNYYAGYLGSDSLIIGNYWDGFGPFFLATQNNENFMAVGNIARDGQTFMWSGDNRFLVVQDGTNGPASPGANKNICLYNNTHLPSSATMTFKNSLRTDGGLQAAKTYKWANNLLAGYPDWQADPNAASNVTFDHQYNAGPGVLAHGSNSVDSNYAATYVDAANGDFTVKAAAAIRSMAAKPGIAAEVAASAAAVIAWLPWLDLTRSAIDTTVNFDQVVGALPYDDYAVLVAATFVNGGTGGFVGNATLTGASATARITVN